MFTLSQVPYLFSTACSDGTIRFWSCDIIDELDDSVTKTNENSDECFYFFEWKLNSTIRPAEILNLKEPGNLESNENQKIESMVKIDNYPLALSCSYNGRFAVAYKKISPSGTKTDPVFYVHIYECESTGGSAWKLEDVLCLENIVLPKIKIGKKI